MPAILSKTRFSIATIILFAAIFLFDPSIYTLLSLVAMFAHESAHIVAVYICKRKIKKITFMPFGVDICIDGELLSYKQTLFVSLSGITINLILAAISFIFMDNIYMLFFGLCNLSLFALNIMPIKSLDGGIALECLLLMYISPEKVNKIITVISFLALVLLLCFSWYILVISGYNLSLVLICVYLVISLFCA